MAVGGNCQIKFLAVERAQLSQITNKIHQAVAQQRLAAGEPDFLDAGLNEDPHQAQVVSKGQFRILRAFITGAAVDALVIAAVRDADAEVSDKAPVFVLKPHKLVAIKVAADRFARRQKGGKDAEACFGSFPNGRPVRFRARPSSLHSQQGAATVARYSSGRMWSEPMWIIIDEARNSNHFSAVSGMRGGFPKTNPLSKVKILRQETKQKDLKFF